MNALRALLRYAQRFLEAALDEMPPEGTEPEETVDADTVFQRAVAYGLLLAVLTFRSYVITLGKLPAALVRLLDLYAETMLKMARRTRPMPA